MDKYITVICGAGPAPGDRRVTVPSLRTFPSAVSLIPSNQLGLVKASPGRVPVFRQGTRHLPTTLGSRITPGEDVLHRVRLGRGRSDRLYEYQVHTRRGLHYFSRDSLISGSPFIPELGRFVVQTAFPI